MSAPALRSALNRRVFIAGAHITPFIGKGHKDFVHKKHADFGKRENPTLEDYLSLSVRGALADANDADASKVEQCWVGNFAGELFCNQGHLGAAIVGSDPALRFAPSMRVEGACASGGLAVASAVAAIQGGVDVGLVAGVEVQTTVSARQGGTFLASASHYREQGSIDDFTFPAMFAMRIRAYGERFGLTGEDLARVSVLAYENANKNPNAHMNAARMTMEIASEASDKNPCFLSNPDLKPYLKVSDCSQVSDGGAGMVLASEEGMRSLGISLDDAVEVLTVKHTCDSLYTEGNLTEMENTREAGRRAYEAVGAKPEDIGVVETHDCFTMAFIQSLEALGFAEPGKGASLVASGDAAIEGRLPVNTGGGLIGMGHPVGATGIKQFAEVRSQMLGRSGAYQMPNAPTVGLTSNMGGNDKTTVVSILARR